MQAESNWTGSGYGLGKNNQARMQLFLFYLEVPKTNLDKANCKWRVQLWTGKMLWKLLVADI